MNIAVLFKKQKICLIVRKVSSFRKFTGLMFRTRATENLLFSFSKDTDISFHSLFVFFPFLMLWLDEKNKVIEWRVIMPFSTVIRAKKKFKRVVEIPLNMRNDEIIKIFVDKGKI